MLEIGMHKHIRNKLRRIKIGRKEKMQSQQILHIDAITSCYNCAEEAQYINNQQIFVTVGMVFIYILFYSCFTILSRRTSKLSGPILNNKSTILRLGKKLFFWSNT